ncbi:hypothetical protein GCM10009864_25580 [Streptomyces lunalinharesii]|uniref:Uncharacterized protein n=1 Tax=Streptomyces lunalinharesii TaxID=333384 RepID=A0ABN3RPX7_9ACTN
MVSVLVRPSIPEECSPVETTAPLHLTVITERAYDDDGSHTSIPAVITELPGENLGRITAAGERVGRIDCMRQHEPERRRKKHSSRSATYFAATPQVKGGAWTTPW